MMLRTKLDSWKRLKQRAESNRFAMLADMKSLPLNQTANHNYMVSASDLTVDFGNQFIDEATLQLLFELAEECQLRDMIDKLMMGAHVNSSENKPALHAALRYVDANEPLFVNSHNILIDIFGVREQMIAIANQIRNGEWLGSSGKAITDIVNIGIGGSQLGPQFCVNALADFAIDTLQFHFISELDPNAFNQVVSQLNPETTLFIISSKSFETEETLYNAKKALAWINQPQHTDLHFIAVTANAKKAKACGFHNVLAIWSWVGGRYSCCSAINLITCIAVGPDNFMSMLQGANEMDEHFRSADFSKN
jgi:glucose-6-phosphate isomerase